MLDRPAQSAFADSQFAVQPCALPALNCGQAGLERDVNGPPERRPARDRPGARAHACLAEPRAASGAFPAIAAISVTMKNTLATIVIFLDELIWALSLADRRGTTSDLPRGMGPARVV